MTRKFRPLPPLPFDILRAVQDIEEHLRRSLLRASNGSYVNAEQARRVLDTCVIEALELQLAHYHSLPDSCHQWTDIIADRTVESAIGSFPQFADGDRFRGVLEATVRDYLRERKRAESQPVKPVAREKMRESYFAKFPEVKVLDVCWAAGQRYSEWKRWLRHAVKDGSAPGRAFVAILTSGKSPLGYRKRPRPKGWK